MPQNVLSTSVVPAPFLSPDDRTSTDVLDYEMGGIALQDPTQGLQVQVWTFSLDAGTGVLTANAPSLGSPVVIFTKPGTTYISCSFDQNMNPAVAFMQDGSMKLYWFDTTAGSLITTNFGPGYENPRLALDDKRPLENGTSDIIMAYRTGTQLRMRMQRDRFGVEYLLYSSVPEGYFLRKIGMNTVNRLQFQFDPVAA